MSFLIFSDGILSVLSEETGIDQIKVQKGLYQGSES